MLPPDFDGLEIELFNILIQGPYQSSSTAYLYKQIPDPINKFIACYVFEAGNTQKEAEIATGLSKATIWKRIKDIKAQMLPYLRKNKLID